MEINEENTRYTTIDYIVLTKIILHCDLDASQIGYQSLSIKLRELCNLIKCRLGTFFQVFFTCIP